MTSVKWFSQLLYRKSGRFWQSTQSANPAMSALIIKSHVKEGLRSPEKTAFLQSDSDVLGSTMELPLLNTFYFQAKM